MCRTRSGVAVKADADIKLYLSDLSDSHKIVHEEHHIRDGVGAVATRHTPVEFVPTSDFLDLDTWAFAFDDERPNWWTDAMTESCIRQFRADLRPRLKRLRETGEWLGDLVIYTAALPSGLSALTEIGGDAYFPSLTDASGLSALTKIGRDASFPRLRDASGLSALTEIGRYASFGSLTDASGLSALTKIGRDAYFTSLTDASGLSALTEIGMDAHFPSLTDAARARLMQQIGRKEGG